MNFKISVAMPVYNTKEYVKDAIESILNQSFKDFEFIILDDYSTDGSYEICQEYSKKDKRIKLYRNEKNMGISYTRNKLVELSTTNFIAIQDSDDISLKDRLKLEYEFLSNNPEYGVVSGNNIIIDEEGNEIGKRIYSDDIKNVILKKSPISQPSAMFKKDVFKKVGGYNEKLNYAEDYDLRIRMYLNGYKIKNLNEFLVKYRIRNGQTKSKKLKETLKNTILIQKNAIKKGLKPSLSDRFYIFAEQILYFFPSSFIMWLFKKLTYKNEK